MSSLVEERLLARRHSDRFGRVSNRYPRRVAEAYAGDLGRSIKESDNRVKDTVAAWEKGQGLEVTDWIAVGEQERRE
jgi:hypothetical protein